MKQRNHNEWFMPLTKTKCECGQKGTKVFAWGEYVNGKWRTILHFCTHCYIERVVHRLVAHTTSCGCSVTIQPRSGHRLPSWLTIPTFCA